MKELLIALGGWNDLTCPYFPLSMNPVTVKSSMVQLCPSFWLVILRDETQGVRGVGWGNTSCSYPSAGFDTSGRGSKLAILDIFCHTNENKCVFLRVNHAYVLLPCCGTCLLWSRAAFTTNDGSVHRGLFSFMTFTRNSSAAMMEIAAVSCLCRGKTV